MLLVMMGSAGCWGLECGAIAPPPWGLESPMDECNFDDYDLESPCDECDVNDYEFLISTCCVVCVFCDL